MPQNHLPLRCHKHIFQLQTIFPTLKTVLQLPRGWQRFQREENVSRVNFFRNVQTSTETEYPKWDVYSKLATIIFTIISKNKV